MKKILSIVMILIILCSFSACGSTKEIDGVTYGTYGLINRSEMRNPNIQYGLIVGNVVWSVILCETILAPIYFIGFSMYEPRGIADPTKPTGSV